MDNVSLKRCIMGAYGVGQNEIVGGPEWLESDHFDIVAKADAKAGDSGMMEMLRNLLAERFKLTLHKETRTIPAYLLEVAKGGAKLEKADSSSTSSSNGRGRIEARGINMKGLAERLGRQLDRPVLDRTGLDGGFNFKLEWTPDTGKQPEPGVEVGPSIFVALTQQLGLRLEPQKAPVEVLVIDRAERPSEN